MTVPLAQPVEGDSLVTMALKVLNEADPWQKAEYSDMAVHLWRSGKVPLTAHPDEMPSAPDTPARSGNLQVVDPSSSKLNRGKGASLASRIALLHSLAHIESWAVDLSWDLIARFGADPDYRAILPREFFEDWVTVADDECRHFRLLAKRLEELGSHYGALPVHNGLWESAHRTAKSLPARLSVEHCVHEARGLDVLPTTVERFQRNGDEESAELMLGVIYPEEITHCGAGVKYMKHLHQVAHDTQRMEETFGADASSWPSWAREARGYPQVQLWFHQQVRDHFSGRLKGPFNTNAREQAGFDESWYMPLTMERETAKGTAAAKKEGGGDAAAAAVDGEVQEEPEALGCIG